MKRAIRHVRADVAVIGAGLAGFAAAVFARARGLKVALTGHAGALAYATGHLDLLGAPDGRAVADPWAGLAELRKRHPKHPLARIAARDMRAAFEDFTRALADFGLAFSPPGESNLPSLLPSGAVKPTLCMPETMLAGAQALARKAPTLIVDFEGLTGFSAREFVANLRPRWSGLAAARMAFPGMEGRAVYLEVMARTLETARGRAEFAAALSRIGSKAEYIGLPAMLGMSDPGATLAEIEARCGARLFEIPAIPPAVPGIRLREAFERGLPRLGVSLEPRLKVREVRWEGDAARLFVSGPLEETEIAAGAVILATGRLLSGGLSARRDGLRESLMGLHVRQPAARRDWYRREYLDPRGHPINEAGLEVDEAMRPLTAAGEIVHPRLFAAGAILAHQDWPRQRCGAGLSLASAYVATRAAAARCGKV